MAANVSEAGQLLCEYCRPNYFNFKCNSNCNADTFKMSMMQPDMFMIKHFRIIVIRK